jgi:hypothetical protein
VFIHRAVPLGALLALGGCGLISSDIADVALKLPSRTVTVDTADWQMPEGDSFPAVDCSGEMAEVCSASIAELCGADGCAGSCGSAETCEALLAISLWNTFDLATESPELQQIDGQPLVSVTIQKVWFEVSENTLDVASPELEVAIAPQSVMNLEDAEPIGTIPSVAPGERISEGEVMLTADGARVLSGYMKNYSTPFNLIVGTNLVFEAGDPLPTGRMVATVHVQASAGL